MTTSKNTPIIDAHAHIFPPNIAKKATDATGQFYDIKMSHIGSSEELLSSGSKINVSKYLVCSTATTPRQVSSINDFIAEQCSKHLNFFGFGTLHPEMEDPEREIERIQSLGLKGIKLHPDIQRFQIDTVKAIKIYKILADRGLPVLFHTGDIRYDFSSPLRLVSALEKVPNLTVIAAHFGGYSEWNFVKCYPKIKNLYFDTSSSLFLIKKEEALDIIDYFGKEQFFFGVDFPMWDHAEELERFMSLNLDQKTTELILYKNFSRLFSLQDLL